MYSTYTLEHLFQLFQCFLLIFKYETILSFQLLKLDGTNDKTYPLIEESSFTFGKVEDQSFLALYLRKKQNF